MIVNSSLTKEYKEHLIFSELDKYINFYDSFSFSILKFLSVGTEALNYETYLISSLRSTLESIKKLLEFGTINDAYALTRKYYDSIVIHVYTSLYIEKHHSLENLIVEKINNWLKGKEKLPDYKTMNSFIRNSESLENINKLLFPNNNKKYTNIRQELNDHTHYNYFQYMMLNDYRVYNPKRINELSQLSIYLREIFIKHYVWMFSVKDQFMMSDDYLDYLEMDMTPPENSQYWVAPCIQNMFDEVIKKYRPDLAEELKKSTFMELE